MKEILSGLNENNSSAEPEAGGRYLHSFDRIDDITISLVGGKAANLVKLRRAGLPIPPGYCVTTDAYDYYIANNGLPDGLLDEITEVKMLLGGKIAIRSSANCEDSTQLSMAGVFQSYYVYKDEEISSAVKQIFDQCRSEEVEQFMTLYGRSAKDVKMGLIIQQLIEPEIAGVIYTGINGNNLLVQYVDGFGASLVDGKSQGTTVLIAEDGTILQSTGFEYRPLLSNTINQISQHSHAIENLFPGLPQDIEFAYRDDIVHIVQARTLTADLGKVELEETPEECLERTKYYLRQLIEEEKRELKTQTAIFSDANYSELLPRPTEMDIGIYMYVWGGSDGIPRESDQGPNIHNHGWHLISKVLVGHYKDIIYDLENQGVVLGSSSQLEERGLLRLFQTRRNAEGRDVLVTDGTVVKPVTTRNREVPIGDIHTIEANVVYHLTTIPEEQLTATLVLDSPAFVDTTDVLINSASPQLSGVQIESAMTEVARARRAIDYTTTVLAKAQLMSVLRERTESGLYLPQGVRVS